MTQLTRRPPQSPQAAAEQEKAKKLVNLSHGLGWGGIGLLFVGAPAAGIALHSGVLAAVFAGLGLVSALVGAIVGQIGRAMQGRVI
ncbi:MAG TPA: hypothetical protein VFQ53_25435 [Kofleriaceae bacterium]|nr:hypothetical protein [Kofleriaceae bacterium]